METFQCTIDAFLETQYKIVRAEIIESMDNQIKILQIAILVIGGLFYGHILICNSSQSADQSLDPYIFAILIPGASFCFTLMLLSEVSRMMLCGKFLKSIEDKLHHKKNILYFEQWLTKAGQAGKLHLLRGLKYLAETIMFLCISALSLLYCYLCKNVSNAFCIGIILFLLHFVISVWELLHIRKITVC